MLPAGQEPDPIPSALSTVADLPFHIMGRFARPIAIGQCRDTSIEGFSSKEAFERVRDLSLGLGALGMAAGDRVAILAESRPEWILCDLAVLAAGAVTVPIYPTLAAAQVRYILQDSGARLAVVSTAEQLAKLQEVRHLLPALEAVVVMDASAAQAASVLALEDTEKRGHARMTGEWGTGRDFRDRARRVKPSDLATIIYTSGTTGEPKGVMLTHANLTSNIEAGSQVLVLSEDDVALSFLPLSHAFERMVSYIYLLTGVQIIFAESVGSIARDIGTVRPTVMTGVPRVYEKLQTRISTTGEAAPGAKGAIFRWAVKAGMARARAHLAGKRPGLFVTARAALADRLVFSAVRSRLGDAFVFWSPAAPSGRQRAGILPRDRSSDRGGLRPDRDRADPDGESSRRTEGGNRRAATAQRRTADCGRRRDFRRAGPTSWPAITTSLKRPPRSSRRVAGDRRHRHHRCAPDT